MPSELSILLALLALQPSDESLRVSFDFDCARARPPAACASALPTAEEAREPGIWNDRAVPLDLNGDRSAEYIAPTRCGATGNCEWLILDGRTCKAIGTVGGALITVTRRAVEGWSEVEVYGSLGAGEGVLVRYAWSEGAYREVASAQLVDPASSEYLTAVGEIRCPAE